MLLGAPVLLGVCCRFAAFTIYQRMKTICGYDGSTAYTNGSQITRSDMSVNCSFTQAGGQTGLFNAVGKFGQVCVELH